MYQQVYFEDIVILCSKIYTNIFRSSRKSPSKDKSNVPDNNFSEVIDFCCCSLGWFLVSGLDAMMSSESPILSVVQLGARWLRLAVLPRAEQTVILVFVSAQPTPAAQPPPRPLYRDRE